MSRIQQEIKHFTELEYIWSGQKTPAGQKRYDNKAVLFRKICKPVAKDKVLEIGSGDGVFTKRLKGIKSQIVATDITPAVIERSKKIIKFEGLTYKIENCEKMSFKNKSFDIVCGISILHHVNTKKTLQECYRVLKDGGRLFFTEPNLLNPIINITTNIKPLRKVMEYSPGEKALLKKDVEKILHDTGFSLVSVKNYDFLLPWAPQSMISFLETAGTVLEKIPFLKEISGSLLIYAEK
ncbi:hypothetical protein A2422_02435 [Candidatus Woesebacteria bacterium RIFOXYC1_FULL_31_51]|uniref:Methyltransferase type 11 domain-containing protein n=1 Tax=Candidatus Woesebacteria bacterium GW2011_GWC2_31_9 TaxID=1618586 RepID=A0A0F9YHX7_9BACT|nr:MAG: hypothetical protein UR17_C0001G0946 [Candidatus Woesebacteria bacterium GW2011_GWF1_31_35]KKP23511.1 MAG: hypothetical protein UR11_C0001G0485 [Candidatus Woesebacteria bacterium GW2011_GWC1_30_29]KKP25689.1 MAG: hypothetical protein UR13_C0007G0010 [Candidatus Woesebacteria bacterium GW2011_GWD1_31_12]KKP27787.1 MAG: hypothetical protein UR16_C0002G0117 [Candidatus Woesebacteria bacterium GW2011_GWB1_31_29]KKP31109.1 MAG: hypothetical protein UR21_C0016G0027 [Candidatus Woesebacteria 